MAEEEQNVNCEIKDALAFISTKVSDFMAWGHCFMYRHLPGLFRWGYRYSEKHPAVFKETTQQQYLLHGYFPPLFIFSYKLF
mgnify:CR=1 FL=1